MGFYILRANLQRINMERVYHYGEYDKTIAYAEEHISVSGVQEYYKKMKEECTVYDADITKIVESEKENENKKYQIWEKMTRIRQISAAVFLASFVLSFLIALLEIFHFIGDVLGILRLLALIVFIIAKIGESICGMIYKKYVMNYMSRIHGREQPFINICQRYYEKIDDLYLNSLDENTRQTVLMRRELAESQRQLIQGQAQMGKQIQKNGQTQQKILNQLDDWKNEWEELHKLH